MVGSGNITDYTSNSSSCKVTDCLLGFLINVASSKEQQGVLASRDSPGCAHQAVLVQTMDVDRSSTKPSDLYKIYKCHSKQTPGLVQALLFKGGRCFYFQDILLGSGREHPGLVRQLYTSHESVSLFTGKKRKLERVHQTPRGGASE